MVYLWLFFVGCFLMSFLFFVFGALTSNLDLTSNAALWMVGSSFTSLIVASIMRRNE
jgi:hypothetical protein